MSLTRPPRRPHPARRGAAKGALLALLVILVTAGAVGYLYFGSEPAPAPSAPEVEDGPMTEAERIAYVKANVTLEGLDIGPDTQPDSDEPVPGLLRVKGEVTNGGDRAIEKLVVAVYPRDEVGEVIAAHLEDVLEGRELAPEGRRAFSFTIPDRGAAEGDFDHELR